MKFITTFPFIFILNFSPIILANTDNKFDHTTAVALILKVEKGEHIFQRPDRDEPYNSFVQSFSIVNKYINAMQPAQSGLALDMDSLEPHDSFLLVNNTTSKTFYLGDHWLGDEAAFAVMEATDYQHLKHIFETRKKVSEKTESQYVDHYIKSIHDLWQEDSEEFFRRFYFPELTLPTPATSQFDSSSSLSDHLHRSTSAAQSSLPEIVNDSSSETSASQTDINTQLAVRPSPIPGQTSADDDVRLKALLLFSVVTLMTLWYWRKRK